MVDRIGRQPRDRVMAIFTNACRLDVRRVLAGCVRAVMAARTVTRDVDVIKVGGYPAGRRVAVIAVVAAADVVGVLTGGDDTVVARTATAQHIGMVYGEYRGPAARRMAVLADARCQNVCRCFAGRVGAVVA